MPHSAWKILPLLPLFLFCKNEQATDTRLFVHVAQTSLRSAPSEKSHEIALLEKNQTLTDLGEVSRAESQIALGCDVFQTPWLKVRTPKDQIGWVLAWAVRPARERADWLLQKRLDCYFGKALAARRNAVCQSFLAIETEPQLAEAWRESAMLRDTFLHLLSRHPESGFSLQLNWIGEALPGFLFQKIGENERPQLFADFRVWQQKALNTKGLQDDLFLEVCLAAFPHDSIESFFPAWKFQLSETESASQLGTGQHLKILRQIDRALAAGTLFLPQLERIKEQILEDVFENSVRYWQPQAKILAELNALSADPPKCLSAREREALGIRSRMFENFEENGIRVNLRSGE